MNMDKDLEVLRKFSAEELKVLVELMEKKLSYDLPDNAGIYPTNHVEKIADEFCKFGGNTIANILRGGEGVSYREVLTDVCKDLKVPFNANNSIEHIERNLLETVLESAWENMSEEDKQQLLDELGYKGKMPKGGIWGLFALQIGKSAGFTTYQVALIIANFVAKQVTGTGLALATNAALTTVLKGALQILGPVLWAWTLVDIASPSKKVTIPGCIYIAALRQVKEIDEQ